MSQQLDIFKFEEELLNQNKIVLPQSLSGEMLKSQDQPNHFQTNHELTLEQRPSIQNGIPIPQIMLSQDAYQLQDEQYQQNQSNNPKLQNEVMPQELIMELGLDELITSHHETFPDNTKNVLRNLGNALHHFIFYHKRARQIIETNISCPKAFDEWVRKLKMENFDHFKSTWASENKKLFSRIYKKLSWIFYSENSIPYILSSRIRKTKTKYSHLKHLYRFLEGIRQPETFTYFKKIIN